MPPAAVKSIKDLIFWQYAKLIAKSAGIEGRGFQMSRFTGLRDGTIQWSSTIREWLREHEKPDECIYCGSEGDLTTEHILPKSRGGPDHPDNTIRVCIGCNTKKGKKRLYEWIGLGRKDDVPRIAEGKYLKLLYQLHEERGTLDIDKKDLTGNLCPVCDLGDSCKDEGTVGKLTVYCLEGCFRGQ